MSLRQLIKYLSILLPLAMCGNVIYIIVAGEPEMIARLAAFNLFYLFLGIIMAFVPWLTQSTGIRLWAKLFRKDLTSRQALRTVLATDLGGAIAPTMLGGGYLKIAFLMGYGFTGSEAALVALLGTLVDGVFFAIAIPLAIIWSRAWDNPSVAIVWRSLVSHWQIIVAAGIVVIMAIWVARIVRSWKGQRIPDSEAVLEGNWLARIRGRVRRFWADMCAASGFVWRAGKGTFAACVAIVGLGWCCRYGAISALVAGLGFHADPVLFFILQWVVFSATTLIPTPGGIGGAELSFGLVFHGLVPFEIIPILTGAWRFVTFYMTIAAGALTLALTGIEIPIRSRTVDIAEPVEELKA